MYMYVCTFYTIPTFTKEILGIYLLIIIIYIYRQCPIYNKVIVLTIQVINNSNSDKFQLY